MVHKQTQDILLAPEVVCYDVVPGSSRRLLSTGENIVKTRCPVARFFPRDQWHAVQASHPWPFPRALDQVVGTQFSDTEAASHGSLNTEPFGYRTGVHTFHTDDAVTGQPFPKREFATPIAGVRAVFLDNEPVNPWMRGFEIVWIDPVVSYERIGHRNDLPAIRRVGQDLLVTSHRRVENDLADLNSG
jgi:hypothetical protein